jgi:uncharacterized protein
MPVTDELLKDLVKRIVETAHPIRIILFGSTVRGEDGFDSDIDVMVVVEDGKHRRNTARNIYRGLAGFIVLVDLVVATVSDLEKYRNSPGLVYREALREGKELYIIQVPAPPCFSGNGTRWSYRLL